MRVLEHLEKRAESSKLEDSNASYRSSPNSSASAGANSPRSLQV